MILNGVIALILLFSPNSIALLADYVTVVEDRPIMSVKYCLPVPVFHFRPKLMYPAARSLCDNWASCNLSFKFRFTVALFVMMLDFWLRWRASTGGRIYARVFVLYDVVVRKTSRSLSHLLMGFLSYFESKKGIFCKACVFLAQSVSEAKHLANGCGFLNN